MSYKSAIKNWEGLAQRDALWSILTDESKKGGKWNAAQFFASGEREVEDLLKQLKQDGIDVKMDGRAMDFGCGAGRLSQALARRFSQVQGVDASPTMVQMAQKHNTLDNLSFVLNQRDDLQQLPASGYQFILSLIVLQHIPYPQSLQFIGEFVRLLAPGGVAVFQLPTKDVRELSPLQRFRSWLKLRERLALMGIGKGFHMHMYAVPEDEVQSEIERNQGVVEKAYYTNHTDPDFNGRLKILGAEEAASGYFSQMFVVRKKA